MKARSPWMQPSATVMMRSGSAGWSGKRAAFTALMYRRKRLSAAGNGSGRRAWTGVRSSSSTADAVMFNLGWLPGAEHGVTTRVETTLQAVNAALEILKEDGVMTICVYPGHDEGAREREALLAWAQALDEKKYDTMLRCYLNQSKLPPLMIAVKRNKGRKK